MAPLPVGSRYPRGMLRSSVLLLTLLTATACHDVGVDGGLVGGSCRDDRDCVERCVDGGKFPDGTCTVDCRDDRDCPADTFCIREKGGVCLLACDVDDECRGGYDCKNEDREGRSGKIEVCID